MSKFNPENERIKAKYFTYEKEAHGRSPQTIENSRKAIIRYEEFVNHENFKTFTSKKATDFKLHLLKTKNKYGEPLSASTIAHTLRPLQDFLKWLAAQAGYKTQIRYNDIEYLNLNENDKHKIQSNKLKEYPSESQIRKVLATMPSNTPVSKRNKAIIAFVFATGVRDGALIGLKIKHLNTAKKYIVQDPKEVATKFRKRIHTKFYPVGDDIHQIILDWVRYLQEEKLFTDNDPLFPKEELVHDAENSVTPVLSNQHWQSATAVRGIFKQAFENAGVQYYSPHRFRDTLSAIGRKICQTVEDQMAWARNMGHESPATTFMVYGGFSPEQQFEVIERMGQKTPNKGFNEGDVAKALQVISQAVSNGMMTV